MRLITEGEKRVMMWIKKYGIIFYVNMMFGVLVYFTIMSEHLVNSNDGLLYTSQYVAGRWEVSSGRGILPYFDKLRAGVMSVSLNTILMLGIISVTGTLILEMFDVKNKIVGMLMVMILVANPVTCAILAYSYTAVNYGLSFFLSVFGVYCLYRLGNISGILSGGLCIALSMGSYQAYFSVTCLLILLLLIKTILQNKELKASGWFLLKSVISVILGGVIYIVLIKLLMMRFNVEISSYKGADQVSLKNLFLNFPQALQKCYQNFFVFFFRHKMFLNLSGVVQFLLNIFIGITVFCVIYQFVSLIRRNRKYAMLFLGCIFMIPLGGSAITLIVIGSNSRLMSMSMIVFIILLTVLIPGEGVFSFLAKRGYCAFLLLFLWVNILSVTNEQLALKEGKTASVGLAEAVFSELIAGNYLEESYTIALVGRPSVNELFARREAWDKVIGENRFGDGWHSDNEFWSNLLLEYCGISLNFTTNEQYNILCQKEEVAEMPEFPKAGSIMEIDGIVVVKISEKY